MRKVFISTPLEILFSRKYLVFLTGFIIKSYHSCFSSLIPSTCRFYPTCSSYALESIEKLGILKGLIKTFLRIGRCHPFSKGGYDPVG